MTFENEAPRPIEQSTMWPSTMAAMLIALATCSPAGAADGPTPAQIASTLKTGGHIIYIRHASTEKDYADQVKADPNDCSTQRTLSENGWREAEGIGAAFRRLDLPVGALYSSQYCRAWQTARLAFGTPVKTAALNFEPAEDFTPEQMEAMRGRVIPFLTTAPADGTNTVIVGHDDPFEAATGIYPEPQGVAYILKPRTNGEFDIIGSIKPSDWNDLPNE
ncbi:histidine phosphatase family protein [Ahrensia sp. R2A130]|uniref:histidine phosphatase family protein n=1 Tax=Ahrensia sp. R2A130 TaxID=744979 RepID=UPI0001E08439|nr:histidine phosphatase family protein [Ahrensia sp. R2A130]EFL88084.1 phosphoglycerate mutase domain-containing protein [Ahrensia sp. R2A130]